jgi:triacylglycerol lipase
MRKVYLLALCFIMACVPQGPKDYCETEHPIMLVPGVSGFSTLIGFVDYWWRIPQNLRKGGATVRCASLSAVIGTEERGEQLLAQVEEFLAETDEEKVHLIGHSHGAPTSRYVAGVRPDLVASVTSIAGGNRVVPHKTDMEELSDSQRNIVFAALNLFGEMFNVLGGTDWPQDGQAMMDSFIDGGVEEFNGKYPYGLPKEDDSAEGDYYSYIEDGKEQKHLVRFYSWTGSAKGGTNILDPVDPFFTMYGKYTDSSILGDFEERAGEIAYEHDSLVPVWSARFGKVIREDYEWNHLDESNMMFGLIASFASNPVAVFRQHANRLQTDEQLPDPQ